MRYLENVLGVIDYNLSVKRVEKSEEGKHFFEIPAHAGRVLLAVQDNFKENYEVVFNFYMYSYRILKPVELIIKSMDNKIANKIKQAVKAYFEDFQFFHIKIKQSDSDKNLIRFTLRKNYEPSQKIDWNEFIEDPEVELPVKSCSDKLSDNDYFIFQDMTDRSARYYSDQSVYLTDDCFEFNYVGETCWSTAEEKENVLQVLKRIKKIQDSIGLFYN